MLLTLQRVIPSVRSSYELKRRHKTKQAHRSVNTRHPNDTCDRSSAYRRYAHAYYVLNGTTCHMCHSGTQVKVPGLYETSPVGEGALSFFMAIPRKPRALAERSRV